MHGAIPPLLQYVRLHGVALRYLGYNCTFTSVNICCGYKFRVTEPSHQYENNTTGRINEPRGSTRVYPKVSGLAAWSKNCKRYSALTLSAVISLFCESV
jgi:hypothetical protein